MYSKVSGPFAAGNGELSKLLKSGLSNDVQDEPLDYEFSELSDDYKKNIQELSDMKRKFYAEHPLPEDNPLGTIGSTQTRRYKDRDAEWAKIAAKYMEEHPISEADKAIIEKELKRHITFMSLS